MKKFAYLAILVCSVGMWFQPLRAQADFIIEFLDGRKVTVAHYFEEGETIKIYTPQGAIGFPKAGVKRIVSVDANTGAEIPLEASLGHRPAAASASTEEKNPTLEKARTKTGSGEKAGRRDLKAEREELTEQYHDVAKQMETLWGKHLQDVEQGAPIEKLEENRHQLGALNQQRHKLIQSARQGDLEGVPDWAQ